MLGRTGLRGVQLLSQHALPCLWAAAGGVAASAPARWGGGRWLHSAAANDRSPGPPAASTVPALAPSAEPTARAPTFSALWRRRSYRSSATALQQASLQASPGSLITEALNLDIDGEPERAEQLLRAGIELAEQIRREQGKGLSHAEMSQLYNELARFLKKHRREAEALDPAHQAYNLLRASGEGEWGPAAAMAGARYGTTLLACGRAREAIGLFCQAIHVLERALPDSVLAEEQQQEMRLELAEAHFYKALAELAVDLEHKGAAAIEEHEAALAQGVRGVLRCLRQAVGGVEGRSEGQAQAAGLADPTRAWANTVAQRCFPDEIYQMLDAYHRLIEATLARGEQGTAVLLWQQMVRLVLLYDPSRDNLAVHLLVCGLAVEAAKVMFVLGQDEEACTLLGDCLRPALELGRMKDHWRLLMASLRLGIAYGAQGLYAPAEAELRSVRPELLDLLDALGDRENPAMFEVDLMLARIRYGRLLKSDPDLRGSPEAAQLEEAMRAGLQRMEQSAAPAMAGVVERYKGLVAAALGEA